MFRRRSNLTTDDANETWSARTCSRFLKRRRVAALQSGARRGERLYNNCGMLCQTPPESWEIIARFRATNQAHGQIPRHLQ